jgi:hypothetical protein
VEQIILEQLEVLAACVSIGVHDIGIQMAADQGIPQLCGKPGIHITETLIEQKFVILLYPLMV